MRRTILALLVLAVASAIVASAKDKPKEYPLTGTVISFHAQPEVLGTDGDVSTFNRRVYVLKTDNSEMQITGWESTARLRFTKSKAQKGPPLSIGQTIKFRTDGKYIWTVLDDGAEHRYYILGAAGN